MGARTYLPQYVVSSLPSPMGVIDPLPQFHRLAQGHLAVPRRQHTWRMSWLTRLELWDARALSADTMVALSDGRHPPWGKNSDEREGSITEVINEEVDIHAA